MTTMTATNTAKGEMMTVPEVAREMGCSPAQVRLNIKLGIWPFGERIPAKKLGTSRDKYLIYRTRLEHFLGRRTC